MMWSGEQEILKYACVRERAVQDVRLQLSVTAMFSLDFLGSTQYPVSNHVASKMPLEAQKQAMRVVTITHLTFASGVQTDIDPRHSIPFSYYS